MARQPKVGAFVTAEDIVATVREPLLVLDAELRVLTANRAFCETFQVPSREAVGQLIYDLGNRQWDIPKLRELLEEILPTNTAFDDFEVEHDFETIGRRIMLLNARKIHKEPNPTELVLLAIEDVTDRKRAETLLREAQEELAGKEKLAVLGRLTATVSHELRNPLGTLRTAIFSLRERTGGRDEMVDRALTRADHSILRCDGIIEELLDYTRAPKLNLTPTSIDDWLGKVLDEATIPEGIRVAKGLACGARVALDGQRFRRCVINVIGNACQAMAGREGQMRLTVETRLDDGRVAIAVKDTGLGIAAEHLEKVFEPLYSTKSFGVGLGLSTVRQIAEEHGGSVDIESHEGEGTVVTLYLPLGQGDEE